MLMPSPPGCGTLRATCGSLSQDFPAFRLISVLAYHLWSWIGHTLRACGDNRDWETLRRILSTHSLVTTVLPLRDGRLLRIRKLHFLTQSKRSSSRTSISAGKPHSLSSNPTPIADDFIVPLRTPPWFYAPSGASH
jgi:hypothetical protein